MPRLEFSHRRSYAPGSEGISLPVVLKSGSESIHVIASVDTGASNCLFEREYAELLNIEVESGHPRTFRSAMGGLRPRYPESARTVMRQYRAIVPERQWEVPRQTHPGGDAQIEALLKSVESFADSRDDMNFTPALLATICARTLIVQGDRDPLYPVELSVEMARAIPNSNLWIVPNAGHGPVMGDKWDQFLATADAFPRG